MLLSIDELSTANYLRIGVAVQDDRPLIRCPEATICRTCSYSTSNGGSSGSSDYFALPPTRQEARAPI